MRKDYAKYTFSTKQPPKKPGQWQWYSVGALVVCVGLFVGWFYIHKQGATTKAVWSSWLHHNNTLNNKEKSIEKVVAEAKSTPPLPHFEFYNELPDMQVTLPVIAESQPIVEARANPSVEEVVATTASPEPKAVAQSVTPSSPMPVATNTPPTKGNYLLQVGAFRNESAASQVRLSLLLAGFEANIIRTQAGNAVIYRLQQGPYSITEAKAVQQKLMKKGISSVVKKS
jgi:cell division septation protein DedD